MTKDDMIEMLAAIEHQRWGEWQQYVHQRCGLEVGTVRVAIIHAEDFKRWERQIATPYADLSEEEQQADRDQVMRYWPMIVDFVSEWLEGHGEAQAMMTWCNEMDQSEGVS